MQERANINHILICSKAKRGIRFVTFKRQVPQSRGLDASNAEFVPNHI